MKSPHTGTPPRRRTLNKTIASVLNRRGSGSKQQNSKNSTPPPLASTQADSYTLAKEQQHRSNKQFDHVRSSSPVEYSSSSANKMVWKRKQQRNNASEKPTVKDPVVVKAPTERSKRKESLKKRMEAPLSPMRGQRSIEAWESFNGNSSSFPRGGTGFDFEQQQLRQHSQHAPAAGTPSTVASTQTPVGDSFYQPQHLHGRASPGLLTPFVSERSTPERPAYSASASTPSSASTARGTPSPNTQSQKSDISHLLKPPKAEDRSDKRRLAYEREKRLTGVYDGEMEPEGVRGQEAEVSELPTKAVSNSGDLPQMRSFESALPQQRSTASSSKHVKIVLSSPSTESDDPSENTGRNVTYYSRDRYQPTPSTNPPVTSNPSRSAQKLKPILRNSKGPSDSSAAEISRIDSASTNSDDELVEMRSDLLMDLAKEEDEEHSLVEEGNVVYPRNFGREDAPSPVAAKAAAAASRALAEASNGQRSLLDDSMASAFPEDGNAAFLADEAEEVISVDDINQLAMKDVANGKYELAIQRFNQVLELQKEQHGAIHPAVASAYHNLGTVHAKLAASLPEGTNAQQKSQQLALTSFQAAARTARDALSPRHPNVAVSLVRIGFLLLQSKQYENAVITFEEALRIRKIAYGPSHALVANLYNNLGVCQMHLGEFVAAREALESALDIQRENVEIAESENGDVWSLSLEVADTLFNIGGLCLEWIRKRGADAEKIDDAEQAFEEALEIRIEVLGEDDPLTVQVRDLLEMTQSIPVPQSRPVARSTEQLYEMERMDPEEVLSVSTPPSTPRSRMSTTPNSNQASRSAARQWQVTPRSHSYGDTIPSSDSMSTRLTTASAPVTPTGTGKQYQSESNSPSRQNHVSAGGRFAMRRFQRSATVSSSADQSRSLPTVRSAEDEKEMYLKRSASSSSKSFGEFRDLDGARLSDMYGGEREHQPTPATLAAQHNKRGLSSVPPIGEVTVVNDETGNPDRGTRVQTQSHFVPRSPGRPRFPQPHDESYRDAPVQFPFDPEENCLVSGTGIDTMHGRIHIPETWAKQGLLLHSSDKDQRDRDIVVTRPSRISEASKKSHRRDWGSDVVDASPSSVRNDYDTGNKERDDILKRANELLRSQRPNESIDVDEVDLAASRSSEIEDALEAEDGLASLGGDWPSSDQSKRAGTDDILRNPMENLPRLYDEACRRLKADNVEGSVPLFTIILRCQRQRYGNVHEHVASSLHNLGIAYLRGQAVVDALVAFEEATKIRQSALGKDHPAVAVSLVKVGVANLILHRFEEALNNFREALSVRKNSLGPLHPSTARIYNNIGCVHVEFDEIREARHAFESALEIQRTALSQDPDSRGIMLATATTLCNLGYLYRHRDLHGKAALVLREAVDLQETVLGRSNPAVLSTLDSLADSSAASGQTSEALRYYNMILTRYRVGDTTGSQTVIRAEAVLLYKMSRVHRQRDDRESQLDTLKLALRSVRALSDSTQDGSHKDSLEKRIVYDMRSCRESIEANKSKWI